MGEAFPLSWSRIDTYLRCPRKFYLRQIVGLEEPPSKAMVQGKLIHEALETFVKTQDVDASLEKLDTAPDYETARIAFLTGRKIIKGMNPRAVEVKFGLTRELNPTGFFDKDCFFRGVIDLVVRSDFGLEIYDYKSGWSRPDPRQIFLYAMALNRYGKDIRRAGYILLRSSQMIDFQITDEELEVAARLLYKVEKDISAAMEIGEGGFPPSYEGCEYCPFVKHCKEEGEDLETRIKNAYLEREQAKAVFKEAKTAFEETEEPIPLNDISAYGGIETTKVKVLGKKEEKKENTVKVIQWLLENDGVDYVSLKSSLPEEAGQQMPAEIRGLLAWEPSLSMSIIPYKFEKEGTK